MVLYLKYSSLAGVKLLLAKMDVRCFVLTCWKHINTLKHLDHPTSWFIYEDLSAAMDYCLDSRGSRSVLHDVALVKVDSVNLTKGASILLLTQLHTLC